MNIPLYKPHIYDIRLNVMEKINYENLNHLSMCIGGTGSGKSIRALSFVECISQDGYHDELLVMTPKDFLDRITGRNGYQIRKGDALIWDEGGLSMLSTEWATQTSKALSKVFQSMRYRNFALYLTVPSSGLILRQVRSLFHEKIHCIGVNQRMNYGEARIYINQYNPLYDKVYNKHHRVFIDDQLYMVDEYTINPPKKSTIKAYEKLKDEHLTKMYSDMNIDFEQVEKRKETAREPVKTIDDIANEVIDSIDSGSFKFIKKVGKNFSEEKIDRTQIKTHFNLENNENKTTSIRQFVLKYYQDKGINYK